MYKEDFMEKVKNIFGTFFDVNSFSIKKLIFSVLTIAGFYILKGLFSTIIIKLFKVKGKQKIKENNFYTYIYNNYSYYYI